MGTYAPADYFDDYDEDEEGFSDDDDYREFKQRMRENNLARFREQANSKEEQMKQRLASIFSDISHGRNEPVIDELEKGLDVDTNLRDGWTPLLLAASVGNAELAAELIKRRADINYSRNGTTPLLLACSGTSTTDPLPVVKVLIQAMADVKAVDNRRRNALMMAAYNGLLDIVKLLLPLSNPEAKDNQKWTALFWAVDGNQREVVKFLLDEGFSPTDTDIRNHTIVDIAQNNGTESLLELLPKTDDGSNNTAFHLLVGNFEFEEAFSNLKKGELPKLPNVIYKVLTGTRSECVMPVLLEKNVGLREFLSMTNQELKDLGVKLPYQRNRITSGLYRLHKHPFHPNSIRVVPRKELCSNFDLATQMLTILQQLITMEASVTFITKHYEYNLKPSELKELSATLENLVGQVEKIEPVAALLVERCRKWDDLIKPADLITKKGRGFPWRRWLLSAGVTAVASIMIYKLRSK